MSGINTGSGPGKPGAAGGIVVEGNAADGAAVAGNPVRIAGKDLSGNTQDILTNTSGVLASGNLGSAGDGSTNNTAFLVDHLGGSGSLATYLHSFNGTTWDRQRASAVYTLQASVTKTAAFSGTAVTGLAQYNNTIVTLDVTVTDRGDANETYDFYITTGDSVAEWDIVHFTQIAATGTHRFTARVSGLLVPQTVTTAAPGVAVVDTATLDTIAAGADQGIKTLGAGLVRHGIWGDRINHELVTAGTTPSITYSITILVKT